MHNAIIESGYTYTFIFRNDKATNIIHEVSNTSKQILYLINSAPNDWIHIYVETLFDIVKLCKSAYIEQVIVYGVTRKISRSLPDII